MISTHEFGGASWMWLVPSCVAVAVVCGWWPTRVAFAVGCGWRPSVWRWQLNGRRSAVVKRVEHISIIVLVNI